MALPNNNIAYAIKYEGLSYGMHEIDLASLGESSQGFAKILATTGHFISTGQYVKQYSAQAVRVTTKAELQQGSIEIWTTLQILTENPLFSGSGGVLLGVLIQWLFTRKDKREMEHLAAALDKALEQNKELAENSQKMNAQLLDTINRMADGLSAAARQALAPVGKSCKSISVLNSEQKIISTANEETKSGMTEIENTFIPTKEYEGKLSELDKVTGACKLTIATGERLPGVISDPALTLTSNVYTKAFYEDSTITLIAKAQIDKDGNIAKLFISDASLNEDLDESAETISGKS